MNFYGLEILDEISIFIFTIFLGIVIVVSWMSTKVDCDLGHVRTIILEANNQRIQNYPHSVNFTNVISMEEMLSSDFDGSTSDIVDINYREFEQSESIDGDKRLIDNTGFINELVERKKDHCSSVASTSNYPQLNDTNRPRTSQQNSLERNIIKMKIKYLDDREKWVVSDIKQTIMAFKRDNFSEELTQDLNVRLMYNGQELKENDRILEQYGLANNCIIHCLISQPRANLPSVSTHESTTSVMASDRSDLEIGSLLFPLFGALLTIIWYCRIFYRHYFNIVTTFALIGMTVIYLIACITCLNFMIGPYTVNNHHRTHVHRRFRSNRRSNTLSSLSSSSTPTTRISFTSTISSF